MAPNFKSNGPVVVCKGVEKQEIANATLIINALSARLAGHRAPETNSHRFLTGYQQRKGVYLAKRPWEI